ncbi:MAG: hypothetical protein QOK15_1597 [Nocardioidaceae bacterium]|nr:hypothetical protein [Nocardioidaceae bacterium]
MVEDRARDLSAGHRLFARYAYAPNSLGYCGPAGAAVLRAAASGSGATDQVPQLARGFSGAWPYQAIVAELAGLGDPLDERVVRAYWTGNELTDAVDRDAFARALLTRIGPQAGRYWAHLDESLLAEAAPTHAFHVLAVYPWSRLLDTGRPEPLEVLDSCRIRWARVVEVGPERLQVRSARLRYDGHRLLLGPDQDELVDRRTDGATFVDRVDVGDLVAVHWGLACEVLTGDRAATLERWTRWQLDAMAPRLQVAAVHEDERFA